VTLDPILTAARRAGTQQAEVFAMQTEEMPVRFEANRLKAMICPEASGTALRVTMIHDTTC